MPNPESSPAVLFVGVEPLPHLPGSAAHVSKTFPKEALNPFEKRPPKKSKANGPGFGSLFANVKEVWARPFLIRDLTLS